jgi:thiamine biosynthesis lipoprotein
MIKRLYPILLIIAVFIVWKWRQTDRSELVAISGKTMGPVVYNIKYLDENGANYVTGVDSVLELFNQSLNTYRPDSEISQFNKGTSFDFVLPYFRPVLERSKYVFTETEGAFDPTVMPLVNAWGFGPGEQEIPDSTTVDSLKAIVDFDLLTFDETKVEKLRPEVTIDFSAIAKGYGVDVVGEYLESKGVENYFVEIGGEILAKGKNDQGKAWAVGIINPLGDVFNRQIYAKVDLDNKAMATSANNYNYRIVDGIRYVHTIDPKSGYPVVHKLLSASVFAPDCMTADAFATAFMVMGLERSIEIVERIDELDAYLIYQDEEGFLQTYHSEGIRPERIKDKEE